MRFKIFITVIAVSAIQACDPHNMVVPPANNTQPSARTGASGNIATIAGLGPTNFGYDGNGGPATSAKLGWLSGIAVDASNNIYVTDGSSNTVRKVNNTDNIITTVAGTFLGSNVIDTTPFAGDGGAATAAHLNVPLSMTVDHSGNLYVVDGGNGTLRLVNASDGKISSVAGKPVAQGYEGDGGPATSATFWNLYGVAVATNGNIYLADASNNVIRMVDRSSGKISTIAGKGPSQPGYTGDTGASSEATLNFPRCVALDNKSNLFIGDDQNHVVRKISNGIITTVAGTGANDYTGDGGPATAAALRSVTGIAVDSDGNLFIADAVSGVIRKVSVAGTISTIAGTGAVGYAGDGGPATAAKLSNPLGVAVDSNDNLYIADTGNAVIRVVFK